MKNKNIFCITGFAVVLALASVLGLSRFFEISWQRENTADNRLNAEIIDVENTSVFDYPYIDIDAAADEGCHIAISYKKSDDFQMVIPAENMLTYQETVNKVGEDIKYLTGFTGHTTTPVFALYDNDWFWKEHYIINSYKNPEKIGNDKVISFTAATDAYTGEYKYIAISYDFSQNFEGQPRYELAIQQEQQGKLYTYIKDIFSVLNSGYVVDVLGVSGYEYKTENCKTYSAGMVLNNSIYATIRFYELDDSGVFYLSYFDTNDDVVIDNIK